MSDTQDERIGVVLWKLELISHGPCQAWNPSGGHTGEPDDRVVAIVDRGDDPEHLSYRRRYLKAKTTTSREAVIRDAEETHLAMVKRQKPATVSISEMDVICRDGEGWEAEVIARERRVTPSFVRKARVADGRDPETGYKLALSIEGMSRADWARSLQEQGLSQAEIADRMSTSQPTVSRLLKTRRIDRPSC